MDHPNRYGVGNGIVGKRKLASVASDQHWTEAVLGPSQHRFRHIDSQ